MTPPKRRFKKRTARKYGNRVRRGQTMDEYADRNLILLELGFPDYKTYLRSSLWRNIRSSKLQQDPGCFACARETGDVVMQVHHGKYTHENLRGESLEHLYSICTGCHKKIEITRSGFKRSPSEATRELHRLRRFYQSRKHFRDGNHVFAVTHTGEIKYRYS